MNEHRAIAVIRAELRDVEQYLSEAPPHSGEGARASLSERADRLRRELAAAQAAVATDEE